MSDVSDSMDSVDAVDSVANGEAALEDVEQTSAALRERPRERLGLPGDYNPVRLGSLVRMHDLSYYPVVALGLLFITATNQSYAFTVLTPEISRTLGISIAAIAGARALYQLAIAVAPLPIARLSQSRTRRAMLCIVTGLVWSVITLTTGFVTSLVGLIVILCLDGLATGSVVALHAPLVVDSYPPAARVRALSAYSAIGSGPANLDAFTKASRAAATNAPTRSSSGSSPTVTTSIGTP